ncbi:GTP 3',8-cyclase MoaA [Marinagarivorans algicola]|uniref:GTP 3',8-cyclase MoaA n=1 Tax=Marinagarivorans algicola TaxID=1513270 RepID=UPI0006BA0317|nr:GTP 3',8-cyclase MoaA [Marinagarivorans algicola]
MHITPSELIDPFGRNIDYLRVSVTDRCDFRCTYCMAEDMTFVPKSQLLTLEETYFIIETFLALGVKKLRITGGEPLIRKDIDKLLLKINRQKLLEDYTITTNGNRLEHFAHTLKTAGIQRINISLDTLDSAAFKTLTRTGTLHNVLRGIDCAIAQNFKKIKLNAVILQGQNDNAVLPLTHYAVSKGLDISFIEEMPLGNTTAHNRADAFMSSATIKRMIEEEFTLAPSSHRTGGPSRYWSILGSHSKVGFISPHSNNFCADCNRVRLTAEGRLLFCLGNEHSIDLRQAIREYPNDTKRLKDFITASLHLKPEKHHFNDPEAPQIIRFMNSTGG